MIEQLDYQSKLSRQLPTPPLRVVYNRSGMHVVAAIFGNGLYWASVHSDNEADYLCAVLNAPVTTELVRPFMTYGKDERDIAKHVWEVPIPRFDVENPIHRRLTELGKAAESIVTGSQSILISTSPQPEGIFGNSWIPPVKGARSTKSCSRCCRNQRQSA
ncbi:hypothetical protein [Mesorhizobium sp. L48C026A00]|uniref:hypothetical protein n=1 Tax=Mesorhizobium sp. L48C026A00 TaxID=1287182 RepID=UPI0003CFA96E|nr:hypothetical protein [Mesorhizobium sp. L48C026A00]ESZ04820.1 hypothetical protein X737_36565 [Mesorhizobium sp. L48C026A00]